MPIDNNEDKLIELIRLAIDQSSEHSHIEFKDGRGGGVPSKVWNAVSAFSNTPGGGYIVFGVAEQDDRTYKVVGGLNLSELQEKIVSTFSEKIRNAGNYKLITLRYEDNDLLVLRINEASDEHKPCYHEDFGLPRGAYVRLGNVNRRITEEEMRSFLRFSPQYKFDKIATGIGKDVLSNSKVESYLKKSAEKTGRDYTGISDKVLKNLGILTESDSGLSVSLAGLLIFSSDNPQKYEISRRYVVRCVRYSGKDVASDIIDKADIEGTLDDLIDQTLKFVLRNIPLRAEIVGAKRVETYGYPEKAIREIIANAVIHRDYQISETYVQVAVFSDRVEVSNPGTLPPGITVENLKESQFSRNKVVARIMNDLDYMEEFGRGIDLVYSFMKEWGLVEPLFKNRSNSFKVTLLGSEYSGLNDRQVKIWYLMQNEGSVTAGLAHKLFKEVSRATINNDLQLMAKLGLIESRGASINTYYVPNY